MSLCTFLSLPHCPTVIRAFFNNSLSEAWMYFVQCQTSHFSKSVIKIQTQFNTAMEGRNDVLNLKSSLQARRDVGFVGIMTKRTLSKLEREGDVTKQQAEDFVNKAAKFYDTCIANIDWWNHSDDVNKLSLVLLLKPLTWHKVDAANEMICNIVGRSSSADDNRLFDQTALCN